MRYGAAIHGNRIFRFFRSSNGNVRQPDGKVGTGMADQSSFVIRRTRGGGGGTATPRPSVRRPASRIDPGKVSVADNNFQANYGTEGQARCQRRTKSRPNPTIFHAMVFDYMAAMRRLKRKNSWENNYSGPKRPGATGFQLFRRQLSAAPQERKNKMFFFSNYGKIRKDIPRPPPPSARPRHRPGNARGRLSQETVTPNAAGRGRCFTWTPAPKPLRQSGSGFLNKRPAGPLLKPVGPRCDTSPCSERGTSQNNNPLPEELPTQVKHKQPPLRPTTWEDRIGKTTSTTIPVPTYAVYDSTAGTQEDRHGGARVTKLGHREASPRRPGPDPI